MPYFSLIKMTFEVKYENLESIKNMETYIWMDV